MNNFTFDWKTKIIFGRNTENEVGKEVAIYSKNILLLYGQGSIKKTGLYDRVVALLKNENIKFIELPGVQPNPRMKLVYEGINICKENDIDFILAVGGGSVVDSAKAIALGVKYDSDVWDFFEEKEKPVGVIATGVILTIPGTGTEAGNGTVVKNDELGLKRNVNTQDLRPKFAILNPELTYTLSKEQTAHGASDMLSHVIERYFAPELNVDTTDRLCEATMRSIIKNGKLAYENLNDYNSRAELMWCATFAHNDFLHVGRTPDFASHKIDHEVNVACDCSHGASIAILLLAWMKYIYKIRIDKFVQFAVRVFDVEMDFLSPERTALEGISRLGQFYESIGLSLHLEDLGLKKEDFNTVVNNCKTYSEDKVGSYVRISRDDIFKILEIAY